MPWPRPATLKRGFGRFKNPRVQETHASILVFVPTNRVRQFNDAMVAATGNPADSQTFGKCPLSRDGNKPATHWLSEFRISDALDMRALLKQLIQTGNPNIQSVMWPDGRLADLDTLRADYRNDDKIEIVATRPDVDAWLAGHGLQRVRYDA